MIHMGLLNIIRRMALREKLPIREIARRTGMLRNTIKKYLNAGTIAALFRAHGPHLDEMSMGSDVLVLKRL